MAGSSIGDQFKNLVEFGKRNPIPVVALAVVGLVVGMALGKGKRTSPVASASSKDSALPEVEVKIGGASLRVQHARNDLEQSTAWMQWASGKPKATLLEWKDAGRWPLLDVPKGWVVAWVGEGKVGEVRTPAETTPNTLIPEKPYRFALVVPAAQRPTGGQGVETISLSSQRVD